MGGSEAFLLCLQRELHLHVCFFLNDGLPNFGPISQGKVHVRFPVMHLDNSFTRLPIES